MVSLLNLCFSISFNFIPKIWKKYADIIQNLFANRRTGGSGACRPNLHLLSALSEKYITYSMLNFQLSMRSRQIPTHFAKKKWQTIWKLDISIWFFLSDKYAHQCMHNKNSTLENLWDLNYPKSDPNKRHMGHITHLKNSSYHSTLAQAMICNNVH